MRSPASRVIVLMLRDHSLTGVMTKRSCRADPVHVAYTDDFVLNGPGAGGPGKHLVVTASDSGEAPTVRPAAGPDRSPTNHRCSRAYRPRPRALFVDTPHIDRLGIAPDGRTADCSGARPASTGHGREAGKPQLANDMTHALLRNFLALVAEDSVTMPGAAALLRPAPRSICSATSVVRPAPAPETPARPDGDSRPGCPGVAPAQGCLEGNGASRQPTSGSRRTQAS